MNSAHIHLVLSHLPVIGNGFGLLLLAYGLFRKSEEVKRISLIVFVAMALATIPVYLSGEPAEEIVENLSGVSHAFIEAHEDAALFSLGIMEFTGAMALLTLGLLKRSIAHRLLPITALASIGALGSIIWTANLGGKIRHTEARAVSVQFEPVEKESERRNKDEKESEHEDEDEDEDDH